MKKELQIKIEQNIAKNEDELFSQISKNFSSVIPNKQNLMQT